MKNKHSDQSEWRRVIMRERRERRDKTRNMNRGLMGTDSGRGD